MKFTGSDYDGTQDRERLTNSLMQVIAFMRDGNWHTVEEIAWEVKNPNHPSISAQIRNARKLGHMIKRRWKNGVRGYSEYRMETHNPMFKEVDGQITFC